MSLMRGKTSVLRLLGKRKTRRALSIPENRETWELTCQKTSPLGSGLESERRREVISAFEKVLEKYSSSVEQESNLPYPKEVIRQAIFEELSENPADEIRSQLEIAFVQLETFLPIDEFRVIKEFRLAGDIAQEMASTGDPSAIVASARILKDAKGDRAVRIQEDISEKMRRRLQQIRSIGVPDFCIGECASAGA
jgi:ribosome maturation protein Sdo1